MNEGLFYVKLLVPLLIFILFLLVDTFFTVIVIVDAVLFSIEFQFILKPRDISKVRFDLIKLQILQQSLRANGRSHNQQLPTFFDGLSDPLLQRHLFRLEGNLLRGLVTVLSGEPIHRCCEGGIMQLWHNSVDPLKR